MRVRATLVIDYDVSDMEAHEKYGTVDPTTLAQSMQTEAERKLTTLIGSDRGVVHASCTVHPLYG